MSFSRSVTSEPLRPRGCSAPGSPGLHRLPEFTQTHVHQVSEATKELGFIADLLDLIL